MSSNHASSARSFFQVSNLLSSSATFVWLGSFLLGVLPASIFLYTVKHLNLHSKSSCYQILAQLRPINVNLIDFQVWEKNWCISCSLCGLHPGALSTLWKSGTHILRLFCMAGWYWCMVVCGLLILERCWLLMSSWYLIHGTLASKTSKFSSCLFCVE